MTPETTAPLVRKHEPSASTIGVAVARALVRVTGVEVSARDPLRQALEQVFARYCEVLTERLNRTPEAHLLAFIEMLGARPEPAVPAHVPLVFKATRAPANAPAPVVPKLTEVAAPPAAGDSEPVVYHTVADLEVLRAEFARAVAADFRRGVIADAGGLITTDGLPAGTTIFSRARPLVRAVHIGHRSLFGAPDLVSILVQVDIGHVGAMPPNAVVEWGIAAPEGFVALTPSRDTTGGLTKSGEVAFGPPSGLPKWKPASIDGVESCWLTCRLRANDSMPAAFASPAPATITRLRLSAERVIDAAPIDAALFGRMPLDVTRDFYPLGERPRFGDVFYLASKGFDIGRASVVLHVLLTNPADAAAEDSPIPPVSRDGEPRVQWEIYTRAGWRALAVDDKTHSLTRDGTITFTVPDDAAPTTIGNVQSGWLRSRLVAGSYGVGRRALDSAAIPTDAPPSIAKIWSTMSLHVGPVAPEQIVVVNDLERVRLDLAAMAESPPFRPFPAYDLNGRVLYLGVRAAPAQLAGRMLNLYIGLAPGEAPAVYRDDASAILARRWQVRGAAGWRDCFAVDATGGLRHPGFVTVSVGDDVAPWRGTVLDPDPALLWLRLVVDAASTAGAANVPNALSASNALSAATVPVAANVPELAATAHAPTPSDVTDTPAIRQIALNAVPAVQAICLERELVGSSSGRPAQSFRTARKPVVAELRLEVREGTEGVARDWVRWNRVDDLSGSDHNSRDFVLDPLSGTLRFGDGRQGSIPPAGGNNVRVSYSAGGGARGNRPPHIVAQLRTTIPYVESVTNCDAATGGQDTEDELSLRRAALARVRHRDRAVCADDYADLARRSSPEVVRAKCRGGCGLSRADPLDRMARGIVSVLIAPSGAAPAPQPSVALLARVTAYLEERCPAGVELILLGPTYLRAVVDAELAVASDASPARVMAECEARVNAFLHPVTGGADGRGWEFGQEPHASDLLAALDGIDGLDHVRALRLRFEADVQGLRRRGDFLVCAGSHTIRASR